jgi:hypothetical protein
VGISDLLQLFPEVFLLFPVTYDKTIDLFVGMFDAAKKKKGNENWFLIAIILTSYRIATYCNDFNIVVLICNMVCLRYGLRYQYIDIEA